MPVLKTYEQELLPNLRLPETPTGAAGRTADYYYQCPVSKECPTFAEMREVQEHIKQAHPDRPEPQQEQILRFPIVRTKVQAKAYYCPLCGERTNYEGTDAVRVLRLYAINRS